MKILIADNQSKVRYALKILLQKQEGWDIAGSSADTMDLLSKIDQMHPDVVLMDWDLPGMQQNALIHAIRQSPGSPAIIIMCTNPEIRSRALALGVDFFISKVDPPDRLTDALSELQQRPPQM